MGNYISAARRTCDTTGKVILPDGTIKVFEHPVAVGELMLEYPQQYVVGFGPIMSGGKLAALPADHMLEGEKVYLMLPMRQGKGMKVSADEARRILDKARIVHVSTSYFPTAFRILPRFARLCAASADGEVRAIGAQKERLEEINVVEEENESSLTEVRPEFLSRELSGRGWKPSLETIKEKVVDKKVPHWLF